MSDTIRLWVPFICRLIGHRWVPDVLCRFRLCRCGDIEAMPEPPPAD